MLGACTARQACIFNVPPPGAERLDAHPLPLLLDDAAAI
jgi:hypothetical protein